MSKTGKTILTIAVSIVLAAALIWWTTRGIDFDRTIKTLQQANYFYVAISVVLGVFAYFLRSQRWRLLLEPMGYNVSATNAFAAVCMNYFWNLLIPRSGEVARCTSLYNMDKTPVDKSFGTVISERVIDMICLGGIVLLTMLLKFDLIKNLYHEVLSQNQNIENNYSKFYVLATVVFSLAIIFWVFYKRIKNTKIYQKAREFLYGIRQGLKTVFLLKKRGLFILYTFGIWASYYLMTYVMVFALDGSSHLSPADGLFLLLVGGIGMVIPASGGIGAYHAAMRIGFIILGLSEDLGVAFGFLVHTPHTLIAVVLGLISFGILFRNRAVGK